MTRPDGLRTDEALSGSHDCGLFATSVVKASNMTGSTKNEGGVSSPESNEHLLLTVSEADYKASLESKGVTGFPELPRIDKHLLHEAQQHADFHSTAGSK